MQKAKSATATVSEEVIEDTEVKAEETKTAKETKPVMPEAVENEVEKKGGPKPPVDRNETEIKVGDSMWCNGWMKEPCTVVGIGDGCFFAEVTDDDIDSATGATRIYKHIIDEMNRVKFVHPAHDTIENLVECIDTRYGDNYVPTEELVERLSMLISEAREGDAS